MSTRECKCGEAMTDRLDPERGWFASCSHCGRMVHKKEDRLDLSSWIDGGGIERIYTGRGRVVIKDYGTPVFCQLQYTKPYRPSKTKNRLQQQVNKWFSTNKKNLELLCSIFHTVELELIIEAHGLKSVLISMVIQCDPDGRIPTIIPQKKRDRQAA